ncbi:MAG: hypothetical protein R2762_19770 [Bryobacteraceae bacterium]
MPDGRRSWLLDSILIFALIAILILPLFKTEYVADWGIIEGTFISDGRFLRDNLPHPRWQPNWYCGNRTDYIYPPALRYGTAVASRLLNVSPARGYHIYVALLYCLGIAGIYVLFRAGSGSRRWAWAAAILTALVSPSFLFIDYFREGYREVEMMPVRYGVLVRYGEGPHMSALAILGFMLAAAWYGLRRGHPRMLVISGVLCAASVLNNFYGATALAMVFPIMVWVLWVAEKDWMVPVRAAVIAALALALTAFWLTPSYFALTLRNMPLVSERGTAWSLWLDLAFLAVFFAIAYLLGHGRPNRAWPLFVAGAFLRMALHVLGNHHYEFRVIGEPLRLVPEFDMLFLFAAILVLAWAVPRVRWGPALAAAAIAAAVTPSLGWVWHSRRYPVKEPDYKQRIEYKVTRWMHENMPGERAVATGSVRFWYDTWFDLPQLGGVSEQGIQNIVTNYAHNQILYGTDPDLGIAWLQAMGVGAAIVHDATSQEVYHDWTSPKKFEGKLEAVHDDHQGNVIYRVPRRYPGFARVVTAGFDAVPAPAHADDAEAIVRYAGFVEAGSPRPAAWRRQGPDGMAVSVHLEPGEKLVVQETYDRYWKATAADGRQIPVTADPVGFLLLDPGPGDHQIALRFDMPFENQAGWVLTLLSAALSGFILVRRSGKAR